jgi:hypothetical protein
MKTFKKHKLDYYNKELFDKISISKTTNYSYLGTSKNLGEKDILDYLSTIGKNDKDDLKNVFRYIAKTIKIMTQKFEYDHFWLIIRTFTPEDTYKNFRWHSDGNMFKTNRRQFKLVSVPKGEGTLFAEPDKKSREKFYEIYDEQQKEFNQDFSNFKQVINKFGPLLNETLKKFPVKQFGNNYIAEFNVGNREIGAIHSEPDIQGERLFFSIVLGTKEEIESRKILKKN